MPAAIIRPLWVIVFAIAILLLHTGVPAKAQSCMLREAAAKWLQERHNERLIAKGQSDVGGKAIELYASPEGSFTILMSPDDKHAGTVTSGTGLRIMRGVMPIIRPLPGNAT